MSSNGDVFTLSYMKSLKISKQKSKAVYQKKTDITMAKDKQWCTKHYTENNILINSITLCLLCNEDLQTMSVVYKQIKFV